MKIELQELAIADIAKGYIDNAEEGVVGYEGKLNIRPQYQREFVYCEAKRNAVIDTIRKGFPLNVMYWVKNENGTFEVLDGQQRTISFCQYINNDFSILIDGNPKKFCNLSETDKKQILDYKLMVYFCEGNDNEKLDWFRIINIAGEKLYEQELRNAVYTGSWLSDAKLKFSKNNCVAYLLAKDYVAGSPIRQDYLETALNWISGGKIKDYMAAHQHDANANALWTYFLNVIEWTKNTFTNYRPLMKGVEWGPLYDEFKDTVFDTAALENEISKLMIDDDISNRKGIYFYVLTKKEKHLNIRAFTENHKISAYEKQAGICPICGQHFLIKEMEADHITPWHAGGSTSLENCQMLCKECNRRKSGI